VNPGQLVQAESCTHKTQETQVTLTFDLNIQQAFRVCQGKCLCKISSS